MAAVQPTAQKPAGNAKPGAKDPKAAKAPKEKLVRTFHPALAVAKNEKGKLAPTAKLDKIPDDFNPKAHKPLQRRDFNDESIWFEVKAREMEAKAADYRKQATEFKALGGAAKSGQAKRLLAMQKRVAELTAQLAAQGLDVNAILAAANAAAAKPAAVEPAKEEAKAA